MTLEGVIPVRLPHLGEQVLPFAISVQVTPLLVGSFCTVAFTTNALAPVFTEANLFVMLTTRAGVIVNVSESNLFVLATDVALRVGWLLGAAGPELGGVYVTAAGVANESVPQAGEHAAPLAVRLQVTPLLLESFCTVARNTTATVPAWTDVTLPVIETEMLFPPFPLPAPAPQPASNGNITRSETQPTVIKTLDAGPT